SLKVPSAHIYLLQNSIIPKPGGADIRRDTQERIFMISNIRQTKNIEFAVELFKQLNWQSTIYGNMANDDYSKKIASSIHASPNIKIVRGVTDFSQVYHQYGIAAHCAQSETGPLVLLEYMAAGVPFVAYKTGEIAEIVSKELPLLFMESFEINMWIERIHEILARKELPEKLRRLFEQHFSPEKYINKCLEIYESVYS